MGFFGLVWFGFTYYNFKIPLIFFIEVIHDPLDSYTCKGVIFLKGMLRALVYRKYQENSLFFRVNQKLLENLGKKES